MKKLVILQFDGEFSTGYKVTLEVGVEGKRPDLRIRGELPQAIDIIQCFQNWRSAYRSLYGQTRVKKIGTRNININDLKQKCNERSQNLLNSFNSWLESQSFNPIINCLCQQGWERGDEIRVLLSTDCQELRKLPWHLWNGFYDIPYFRITPFEVALSAPDAERRERPYREKIRILIILGDSTGINVKADEQLLQQYCGDAEIVTLVEPLRQELNNYLQDEIGWDILSFSGHSQTQGTQGRICLNHDDSLTMGELRDTLLPAIAKRLQLAIFNSCDGLGIASELESLQIPQVIVMREPVPDMVAQEFLKYFLESFTGGRSLCISVGYARKQLQRLEEQFPCASWLPVIVQNQLEMPPTWQSLGITRSPYRGLMAFREEDAENFFGREAFVEQLVIDVNRKPLVAVIGASGSGKSSVVFAGLIPQLRQNNIVGANCYSPCDSKWQIISFRLGKNPFESLAIALEESRGVAAELIPLSDAQISGRRQELELEIDLKRDISALQKNIEDILHTPSPNHLLLVVDQFEEIYTLCPDAQERQIFIDCLLKAVHDTLRFTLLLTLRADFLGKAMSYQPLGKALQDYPPSLLAPMNREELERAITQPAAKFSAELEEGLVNKLIDDVGLGEGSLPLQQFALTQLWTKQRPGLLTHHAYKEIGGVTQAITNHAEAVYARFSESEQKRAQRVFIQLVQPGEGTEDTRRLATRDEVGEDNWDLVTFLADERLLVTNRSELIEDTVEVVHEALIRNWGRLRGWMDDNRERIKQKRKIENLAKEWQDKGKSNDYLLQGKQLKDIENWKKQNAVFLPLSHLAKEFILRSIEKRQNSRFKFLLLGIVFVAINIIFIIGEGTKQVRIREYIEILGNSKKYPQAVVLKAIEGLVKEKESLSRLSAYHLDVAGIDFSSANLSGANFSRNNLDQAQFSGANLNNAKLYSGSFINTDFSGANLNNAELYWGSFINTDFSGANLSNATFWSSKLTHANLSSANLSNANLVFASLDDANLSSANLSNAFLDNASFVGANLAGANLSGANLTNTVFSKSNLTGANLTKTVLTGTNFTTANLSESDMSGTDLTKANLVNANLTNSKLISAKLTDIDLTKSIFDGANLTKTDLSRSKLNKVSLVNANLTNSKLTGAKLIHSDLTKSNLTGVNFTDADLKNTNLTYANLNNTDLRGVKNLTYEQIKYTFNWETAKYDKEFRTKLGLLLKENK